MRGQSRSPSPCRWLRSDRELAFLEGPHNDRRSLADTPPEEHENNGSGSHARQHRNEVFDTQSRGDHIDDGLKITILKSKSSSSSASFLLSTSVNPAVGFWVWDWESNPGRRLTMTVCYLYTIPGYRAGYQTFTGGSGAGPGLFPAKLLQDLSV